MRESPRSVRLATVTECLRSVEMIYLTLAFITTPIFYLSGTIWPLQAMPGWVRAICC